MLIIVAAVIAVGAFLVLKPDDEGGSDKAQPTTEPAEATTATAPEQTTTTEQTQPEKPAIETIRVKDGQPVGGLAKIGAKKGDTVTFQVSSDADHEIHLHGYDVAKDVTAEKPVVFKLKATETGIFEIELEDTKTPIAELKVEP